ncbi:cell division protein FtsA [Synechococcus sp. UW140]|uniref:cell division protein FtsA n=1 Tax=Synechococcus sp. UW140 TaxID=368503 RepID=UPI0025F1B89C|nr:cell division protein FtsA [Synechococcus sp. UW140]
MHPTQGDLIPTNMNNILNHPWFPKTEPAYSGGATAGEWQGQDQEFLGRIANDLVYERANSRINSLPTPWSRALQFEQAILNPKYPTRSELLEELFGCLATIGLWEIIGVKLEAERVDIAHLSKQDDEAVGPFARSLSEQIPSADRALYKLQDGTNPWASVHVLKVDGLVIGFTSPSTLVCPTVNLARNIQGMRWTAESRFSSPKKFLSTQQRQALADWLAYVDNGLLDADDLKSQGTVNVLSALSAVLGGFVAELTEGRIGSPVLSEKSAPGLPPRPKALALLARGAGMNSATATSLATLEIHDRKEHPIVGLTNKPVVLVDPEMPSKLGIPANEITLFGASTLEAIAGSKEKLEQLYGRSIDVITPVDLFAQQLYLLPGEAALTNTWLLSRLEGQLSVNGLPVTPILPLRERVRDLFSSRELEKACSLRVTSTGSGMELELTLMLQFIGQREAYPLVKSFPVKEENLIDEDLPVITIWPNVSDEKWRKFYIFCEDTKSGLTVDGFSDYELQIAKEGQQIVKYFTSKRFPDLVKLIDRGRQCGLIPVNTPPESSSTVTSWSVGIDFGTSFTNYYIGDGSTLTRKPLETRLLALTSAVKEFQINLLTKFFVPEDILPKGYNPPVSTAVNTYGWQTQRAVVPNIFHQARIHWSSSNAQTMSGPGVHTGFKWKEIEYQQPFLKEIALLISCNATAAGAIQSNWSVSYPSAFSVNEARGYRKCWANLCTELKEETGILHEFVEDCGEGGLQTEAVAFANYFGNYLDRPMVHTACLDVGGGTTDMSIWQDNILLHQVSIPFAGRDLGTQVMQLKPAFIRFLFSESFAGDFSNDDSTFRQDPNFNSRFDNALRYGSDTLLKNRIPILRNQNEKELIEFVSIMSVCFAGIYHYLGLILKGLHNEGLLKKQLAMPVYMGGNGARFMNWLDESGSFSKDCDSDQLMGMIQTMSAGFFEGTSTNASTTLSDKFKDETACGLISKGVKLKGLFDPRQDRMFAGECLTINGSSYGALDRVTEPDDGTVKTYELTSTDELNHFVSNYDAALKKLQLTSLLPISKLSMPSSLWSNIETEIRKNCLERIDKEFNDLEPEPPFITGLKALSRVLSREWAERY